MAKIQLNLDVKESKIVELYKVLHNVKTKQETIKRMIRSFEEEIKKKISEKGVLS